MVTRKRPYLSILILGALLLCAIPAHAAIDVPTKSSGTTASGTSHVLTLPTGIVSGDWIVAVFGTTSNDRAITWPTSPAFTELRDTACFSTIETSAAYRKSDGSEGASITVTTGGTAVTGTYEIYRITGGHASSVPEASTVTCSESTAPNPGSVTASWGSEENLFIAAHTTQATSTTSAYPTNYTLQQATVNNSAIAGRILTAASDDPGTFTISGTNAAGALTIVVRPAAGGGAPAVSKLPLMGVGGQQR